MLRLQSLDRSCMMLGMETHIIDDTDYYTWCERWGDRLLTPCSDESVYEHDYGFIFPTAEAAILAVTEMEMPYDPDTWVLVHYKGEIIPTDNVESLKVVARDRALYAAYRKGGATGVLEYVRNNFPDWAWGDCPSCDERTPVTPQGYCAVCWDVPSV